MLERRLYVGNSPIPVMDSVIREECSRSFRRLLDMKRHKCAAERRSPVSVQRGFRQCGTCSLWFTSVGSLAVNRCLGARSASGPNLFAHVGMHKIITCCYNVAGFTGFQPSGDDHGFDELILNAFVDILQKPSRSFLHSGNVECTTRDDRTCCQNP